MIFSFWHTREGFSGISLLELLTIKSWLDKGYEFNLYTYDLKNETFKKITSLYKNFILKDAREIIPLNHLFFDNRGAGLAAFSDYFRFYTLYERGGVWVDLDMICLNYFDFNTKEYLFIKEIDDDINKQRITTSLIKYPQQSLFGKELINKANKLINDQKIVPWGIIGPSFLAKMCQNFSYEKYAQDYLFACQIPWSQSKKFIHKKADIDWNMPCLHLFTEMWRTYEMDKNCFYIQGIYATLLKKYDMKNFTKELNFKTNHELFIKIKNKIKKLINF